jgi:transposase
MDENLVLNEYNISYDVIKKRKNSNLIQNDTSSVSICVNCGYQAKKAEFKQSKRVRCPNCGNFLV